MTAIKISQKRKEIKYTFLGKNFIFGKIFGKMNSENSSSGLQKIVVYKIV